MSNTSKNMIFGSMAVAALVGVAAILDLVMEIPFAGSMLMDIMFIISSALVLFMGYDSYQDLK